MWKLFSARQKEQNNPPQDLIYDSLPNEFRMQVIYILTDAIGGYQAEPLFVDTFSRFMPLPVCNGFWEHMKETVLAEYGLPKLGPGQDPREEVCNFLFNAPVDRALDVIEMSFAIISEVHKRLSHADRSRSRIKISGSEAISQLNRRFKQHNLGYQFVGKQLTRVDSNYIQSSAIEPALKLLRDQKFAGAEDEFQKALDHYRKQNFKEAIVSAGSAFESTMKTICDLRRWTYDKNKATASVLISIMFEKKLIPDYLQSEFSSLRGVLEAGLPTTRNRTSGHGQGQMPKPVPEYIAGFALNMCAANILLLLQAHKDMK